MSHMPIKYLNRSDVEKMAKEAGLGSFAQLALLEADFLGKPVRFLLIGKNKLVVQLAADSDPED